jgi:GTP cyclohydrolase I
MIDRARAARAVDEFLRALGLSPERDPELKRTAELVSTAYADELLIGYAMDPAAILSEGLESSGSEVVALRDIETSILCPHHLMPASGVVHVAYAPGGRIVGFGAIARLVTCFARRLILQETLVQSIADALVEHLGARGAGCAADLAPTCLSARGERCHAARAVVSATAGEMRAGAALHADFAALIGAQRSAATSR